MPAHPRSSDRPSAGHAGSIGLGVLVALVVPFILTLAALTPAVAGLDGIDPSLSRALASRSDDTSTLAVWVYFQPRELDEQELTLALQRAAARLGDAAARRRAKVSRTGSRLVTVHDLPLDARHLERAAATGAVPRRRSRWLGAASYDATAAQIEALSRLDCVRRIAPVGIARTLPVPEAATVAPAEARSASRSWSLDYGASLQGLELINVPAVHDLGYSGAGVTLGFLDSGFRMTHEAVDHVPVVAAYDFANDDAIVDWEGGDEAGIHAHGTKVAAAALGFESGEMIGASFAASAMLAKIDDGIADGATEEDWWVEGLEWLEAQGADLVSSSYGYYAAYGYEGLDGNTAAATLAAERAAEMGLLVLNAAGNGGSSPELNLIVAPADGDSVVAVGATDADGLHASWSAYGPTVDGRIKPDVAARGVAVATIDADDDHAYGVASGTSLSTPLVAGVAALVLERAPFLTPMQLREALRRTAGHGDAPNDLLGWGVVDALEAVFYWGPRFDHEPLPATGDPAGPYVVEAVITDPFGLAPGTPALFYRAAGGAWQQAPLTNVGGDLFRGEIPGMPLGTTVEYYLTAGDVQGLAADWPRPGAAAPLQFQILDDVEPPVLTHAPLSDQPLATWPPAIVAAATDASGVDAVRLYVSLGDGAEQGPIPLQRGVGEVHALPFPLESSALAPGDTIRYRLAATDASSGGNTAHDGPHAFAVVEGAGEILLVYDGTGSGEAVTASGWLNDAGYDVTIKEDDQTSDADYEGKQLVVYLAGDEVSPLGNAGVRQDLQTWVGGGGRLLIEGGEVGFAAMIFPAYPAFAAEVLHVAQWRADDAGSLVAGDGHETHPLLTRPETLTLPLAVDFTHEWDQDAMTPAPGAEAVLECSGSPLSGGAIVHDDNPLDPAVQVVYLSQALSALADQEQARRLVINSVALLLDTSMPTAAPETAPRTAVLHGATPNPFNARTEIRFELAQAGPVRLELYDIRGRLVRSLDDGTRILDAGPHAFPWDGRDGSGRELGSGVYLVHFSAGGVSTRGEVVLVK